MTREARAENASLTVNDMGCKEVYWAANGRVSAMLGACGTTTGTCGDTHCVRRRAVGEKRLMVVVEEKESFGGINEEIKC